MRSRKAHAIEFAEGAAGVWRGILTQAGGLVGMVPNDTPDAQRTLQRHAGTRNPRRAAERRTLDVKEI